MHGERDRIALAQWHQLGAALHSRALFRQDEFAPGKVFFRFREPDRDLKRKREVTVEVLMQAVEIAWHILEQQRRRTCLTSVVALLADRP